jgi:hypothetical protein
VLIAITQITGLISISIGLGLIYPPLGIIAFGVSLVLVGLSVERSK